MDSDANIWTSSSMQALQDGNARLALACADIALDIAPGDDTAWRCKYNAIRECSPQQFSSTEEQMREWRFRCLHEILRISDDDPETLYILAAEQGNAGEHAAAVVLLERALDLDGNLSTERRAQVETLLGNERLALGPQGDLGVLRTESLLNGSTPVMCDLSGSPLSARGIEIQECRALGLITVTNALLDQLRLEFGPTAVEWTERLFGTVWHSTTDDATQTDDCVADAMDSNPIDTSAEVAWFATVELTRRGFHNIGRVLVEAMRRGYPDSGLVAAAEGALAEVEESDREQAYLHFLRATQIEPECPDTWMELIRFLLRSNRVEYAREICGVAVAAVSEEDRPLLLLQAMLDLSELPSRAIGILYRLELKHPSPDVLVLMAATLLALGRPEDAREKLAQVDSWRVPLELRDLYESTRRALPEESPAEPTE